MMKFSAQQIATLVQGQVEGDPQVKVGSFSKIEEGKEGDLCFLANPKYEAYLYKTNAGIVIVGADLQLKKTVQSTLIRVPDAYAAFALLLKTYQDLNGAKKNREREAYSFVHPGAQVADEVFVGAFAYISSGAVVAEQVDIYPHCYIGDDVHIGRGTVLFPGVKIYAGCRIGANCILHAGTVIGSDGFGFAPQNGMYQKIPQLGNVIVEDDVEIGANCTIDRATMGSTIIRQGAKLDNLIQVAHNVEIGAGTVIAAQAGISGSTKIGPKSMIGGQAGVVGHIRLAEGTRINAQSGVAKTVETPNTALTGSPAFAYREALKSQVVYRQLPDLLQRLEALEKQLRLSGNSHS